MNSHCQDCGSALKKIRDIRSLWLVPLKCPNCSNSYYLEVGDPKWIYPLQRLEPGVGKKLEKVSHEVLELATERIRRIDYKTVSIIDFEATIEGHFDESKKYRIVYPDGSEK